MRDPDAVPAVQPSEATLELHTRPLTLTLHVRITPGALLAIGGMVSGILLSTAALVWTATTLHRRHPFALALRRH